MLRLDLTAEPRWLDLGHGVRLRVAPLTTALMVAARNDAAVEALPATSSDEDWDAIIGSGGSESACGWCRDRWGFSWQIAPRRLLDLTTSSDRDAAKRAFEAMMTMRKIDIAALDAAVEGT